ncbi:ribonuclease P protein component [Candidatus Woesebacteria bacterium RBG_19FT_COMBO_47_8]|uniref:Ribonuclease P protein component n=1 Tax=Candidatus Woesebacteria bacterium RBG_13_46_13 TaxID=1802479 RepID=A0A1F7X4Z6_9BACT|nr:MAG: ribonuclease P protein component [Candidatus Woesebacteria bacterium RBG_13_46_13]OGM16824.1 MAG: ribonuclease P protein component [Candidatus Woesebacteria bacterium RBG_19FT_COMBO_47_8]HJX59340.1 ribonuclease P protein component [Patescibacteria group bacterium]
MLAKEYLLSGKKTFENVLATGTFVQAESFGLCFLEREDGLKSKYGFIVSTKVSKEAVQRNRIKRALSEAVRFLTADIVAGYDVVFLAKQKATAISTDNMMNEVRETLKKANLLK